MTDKQKLFIAKIAPAVQRIAPEYGILVCSPIIAQAILESGWGESKLSKIYFNFFGMKAGSRWTGKSVNMKTAEEYTPGTWTNITDNFRVYDSLEDGIRGYFEFIQLPRYHNLRGIMDPEEYVATIKADGYATSSAYVRELMQVIEKYQLTDYDPKREEARPVTTAQTIIDIMYGWKGLSRKDKSHKPIIDLYNSHRPLARSYKVTYTDNYCATTISSAYIKAHAVDLIGGTECSVQRMIDDCFKPAGIWKKDRSLTPKPGWIITYDWDGGGWADHIGLVVSVANEMITVIEGNYGGEVKERRIRIGDKRILGYAIPKYQEATAAGYPKKWPSLSNGRKGAGGAGYYKKGDGITAKLAYTDQIKRMQRLINWVDDTTKDVKVDGRFGENTERKVNVIRKQFGLDASGRFTKTVLDKCKEIKK